jgi:hypothetical protein
MMQVQKTYNFNEEIKKEEKIGILYFHYFGTSTYVSVVNV